MSWWLGCGGGEVGRLKLRGVWGRGRWLLSNDVGWVSMRLCGWTPQGMLVRNIRFHTGWLHVLCGWGVLVGPRALMATGWEMGRGLLRES